MHFHLGSVGFVLVWVFLRGGGGGGGVIVKERMPKKNGNDPASMFVAGLFLSARYHGGDFPVITIIKIVLHLSYYCMLKQESETISLKC